MREISIAGRVVGRGRACFIIAEAGSNHDRKLSQAHQLVDLAADARADAVKFQSFVAPKIAARTTHRVAQIQFGGANSLYELYEKMQLPPEWQAELSVHAKERGIIFLSTPFDEEAADELDELGVPAFKIASFELLHFPLLRHVAKKKKPVILSTGMANLGEIEQSINAIRSVGLEEIALLHCAINYPSKYESVNLAAMDTMAQAFQVPVGYSDHTPGISVPIAAVARGACIFEKHFTLNRQLPGADHSFALEPDELKAMVAGMRQAEAAIGSSIKQAAPDEIDHLARGRRSLFARVDIPAGTVVTSEMVSILRPGVGLPPSLLEMVVGRRTQQAIRRNEPITWDKI